MRKIRLKVYRSHVKKPLHNPIATKYVISGLIIELIMRFTTELVNKLCTDFILYELLSYKCCDCKYYNNAYIIKLNLCNGSSTFLNGNPICQRLLLSLRDCVRLGHNLLAVSLSPKRTTHKSHKRCRCESPIF